MFYITVVISVRRTPNRIKIVRYMLNLQIYMLAPLTFEYYVSYLAGWL